MMATRKRNKRKSTAILEKPTVELKEVSNPLQLPVLYLVLPEAYEPYLDKYREKLLKRGLRIVEPMTIYKYIHPNFKKNNVDLCVELEKIE